PQRGADVQLSIDLDVQRAAEESLARRILAARNEEVEAPGGAVVVLDASDGSVVAMASFPTFDPSGFVHGIRTDVWEQLNAPESHLPLNNRAIQGLYPPASTFKIVTGTAGVTTGLRTVDTTIVDRGAVEIGDRLFRNAGQKSHGVVDLRRAITVSSDVYFYQLAAEINSLPKPADEEIQRVARLFGFDEPTGIELPFEQGGRVPDRAWKRGVNEANPAAFPEGNWFTGDTVNMAIGQGDLLATPLQITNAYAALANGGDVHRPHLGARVIDRFGSVVREITPEVEGEVTPLKEHAQIRAALLQGMRGAVAHEDGTAYSAFRGWSGPPVAGKTGTAQVGLASQAKIDTSLFVGLFPADQPRYVVGALAEQAGAGSAVAAPIVRDVMANIHETENDPTLPAIGTLLAPSAFVPDPCVAEPGTTTTTAPDATTTTVIGAVPVKCPGSTTTTASPVDPTEPARPPEESAAATTQASP
ncbi:MAG TPA: penicillin-binding transpeptidase domain-containing protein, partial [Acidimicrobiia bacterium]|nr:penicillin-binding transpeptidase domain-containing protein [Acidimicrobiia bacterium]